MWCKLPSRAREFKQKAHAYNQNKKENKVKKRGWIKYFKHYIRKKKKKTVSERAPKTTSRTFLSAMHEDVH